MILDFLDLFILKSILRKQYTTTWEMAKNFSWGEKTSFNKKSDKDKFVSGKTNLIDYRIKKFVEGGLIKVERDNGEKIFILDLKRIKISNHKLPNGYKECILIKDKDEKWMIFQL